MLWNREAAGLDDCCHTGSNKYQKQTKVRFMILKKVWPDLGWCGFVLLQHPWRPGNRPFSRQDLRQFDEPAVHDRRKIHFWSMGSPFQPSSTGRGYNSWLDQLMSQRGAKLLSFLLRWISAAAGKRAAGCCTFPFFAQEAACGQPVHDVTGSHFVPKPQWLNIKQVMLKTLTNHDTRFQCLKQLCHQVAPWSTQWSLAFLASPLQHLRSSTWDFYGNVCPLPYSGFFSAPCANHVSAKAGFPTSSGNQRHGCHMPQPFPRANTSWTQ